MPDPPRRTPQPSPTLRLPVGRHRLGGRLAVRAGPGGLAGLVAAQAALADRMPDGLRLARVSPGRRAVFGAVAVVLLVGAVLGVRLAMASAAARPVPVHPIGSAGSAESAGTAGGVGSTAAAESAATAAPPAGSTGGPVAPAASTGSTGPSESTSLLVHVAGRVRHPGVVRLAAGARVQDALRAAGGALPGSDLVGINLAQLLTDGEQVLVARVGRGSAVSTGGGVGGGTGAGGPGPPGATIVDLNTADVAGLDALPGVGPVLAQRILDWRTAHGRFTTVDELDEVSGIGDKLLAEIRPHVRL
jgi:competence protein ComEA